MNRKMTFWAVLAAPKAPIGVYIPYRFGAPTPAKKHRCIKANGFGKEQEMIEVEMDMKIVSMANVRMHWAVKAKLVKSQRQKAFNALASVAAPPALPCTIVLTRVAPRALDGDNLQSGFKAVRDGVADWLGVDDRSKQVEWQYRQRPGTVKTYKVEIEVIA
jgi:hypothetical protein